jgi:hypothetical protein
MSDRRMINAINKTEYSFWRKNGDGTCFVFTPLGHYVEFDSVEAAYKGLVS